MGTIEERGEIFPEERLIMEQIRFAGLCGCPEGENCFGKRTKGSVLDKLKRSDRAREKFIRKCIAVDATFFSNLVPLYVIRGMHLAHRLELKKAHLNIPRSPRIHGNRGIIHVRARVFHERQENLFKEMKAFADQINIFDPPINLDEKFKDGLVLAYAEEISPLPWQDSEKTPEDHDCDEQHDREGVVTHCLICCH